MIRVRDVRQASAVRRGQERRNPDARAVELADDPSRVLFFLPGVVYKGFISANILKGDVSDVGPGAIAIRVTSAEVIIVAFQQGF